MSIDDEDAIARIVKQASAKARGYADFFSWPPDRDLEGLGIARLLNESLIATGTDFFTKISSRGRGNDPPDCEARDVHDQRLAIEVTELVDPNAIRAFKQGHHYEFADWTQESFVAALNELLLAKDSKFSKLKDAPYPGGYLVVIHTDEPKLSAATVASYLLNRNFKGAAYIDRAFLLLSYDPDPNWQRYPHFELSLAK